jgi:hypothetical protein
MSWMSVWLVPQSVLKMVKMSSAVTIVYLRPVMSESFARNIWRPGVIDWWVRKEKGRVGNYCSRLTCMP